MANTLEDLYFKYIDGVGQNLESDRYFQYLYAMVEAGNNVLQQKHQILKKVVDERWIATIEDSLDAINNIIDKPRRFITTSEEVVPVSLAKKITADSVRHLSMNTQFIATNEDGDIMPSKILNVTTEESYDLYENRFIYHLIYRLIAFVDKRTDVIFWSTGNETSNSLSMETSVDDAYEQINYKIQMTIKNTQSLVENDSDNMQVFMRIDRIRRLVFALRNSAFFSIMNGCSAVHSPIQRTNLMMKDPDYRTCYKLWQFLESYDEVGYTIEPEDSTLEFDEEYMIQMYTNLITNYTVFKSILETDSRDLVELEKKKREPIKPKFVKEIKEEIVDSRDIPDVEVRQVFIEEVTQAQLDAEAKLEEMTKKYEEEVKNREEAEDAEAEAQRQMQDLYQQVSMAMQQQMDAEDELERVTQEKDEQITQLQEQNSNYQIQIQEQKETYDNQIQEQKETYDNQIQEQKVMYENQIQEQVRIYELQLSNKTQEHENLLNNKIQEHQTQLADLQKNHETKVTQQKESYESQIAEQKETYEIQLVELKKTYETQIEEQKKTYETQIEEQKKTYETQIEEQKEIYEAQMLSLEKRHEERVSEISHRHLLEMKQQNKDNEEQMDSVCKQNQEKLEQSTKEYEEKLHNMEEGYEERIHNMTEVHEERLQNMTKDFETQMTLSAQEHQKEIEKLQQKHEEDKRIVMTQLTEKYKEEQKKLETQKEEANLAAKTAEERADKAEKAKKRAEEKSEGTRLSRYIISSLTGKNKKNSEVDGEKDNNKDKDE